MRQWLVFNGFRWADGAWLQAYVWAGDEGKAKQLAIPVFRYLLTKHQRVDASDTHVARGTDPENFDAFPVSETPH